jgi:hypothetical protein
LFRYVTLPTDRPVFQIAAVASDCSSPLRFGIVVWPSDTVICVGGAE